MFEDPSVVDSGAVSEDGQGGALRGFSGLMPIGQGEGEDVSPGEATGAGAGVKEVSGDEGTTA